MSVILLFLILGAFIGILAGLLGIGGGAVIVPTMLYFFAAQGVETSLMMKMALGTSFATIVFTGISSVYAHNHKGSVLWKVVGIMAIGCILGVLVGSSIVNKLSNTVLQIIFCFFLAYVGLNMLFNASRPEKDSPKDIYSLLYIIFGWIIGFASSFVGIGGGSITVPILAKVGYKIKYAIGSSSALGVVLAFFGALSAIVNGWGVEALPAYSVGYVYLPAFVGISLSSVIFAPLGAKLVYRLPVKRIRQFFAFFLLLILTNLLYKLYTG